MTDAHRYNWEPLLKPWYWIFTFWRKGWKEYGRFVVVPPGSPEYDSAQYEAVIIKDLGRTVFVADEAIVKAGKILHAEMTKPQFRPDKHTP